MKKETNVKRTGCYIRRNRFILGAAAGLLLAAALPFGALGAEKGWQTVDGAERYVDETGGIVTEQWKSGTANPIIWMKTVRLQQTPGSREPGM